MRTACLVTSTLVLIACGGGKAGTRSSVVDASIGDASDAVDTTQPDGSESCQDLMAAYDLAVGSATTCVVGAANQCQQLTLARNCTNCYRGVQDATMLDALWAQLRAQGCIQPVVCPCVGSGPGTCVASTDSSADSGTCANGVPSG
jgi:hypothetical protein